MSRYFQLGDLFFYPQKNEIHNQTEVFKVRPKTADLLTVLLEAKGEIVSKQTLLQQVWNDVVVEEYVIFQSIAELRKIFGESAIIKTHPRKGYSVTSTIKECVESVTDAESVEQSVPMQPQKSSRSWYIGIIAVFSFALLFLILYQGMDEEPRQVTGSILVLPVKNHIEDTEHSWLKFGGMDLLIKRLKSQLALSVLQTEDVLEIIKRAEVDVDTLDNDAVSRIFEVSGAQLIIEQSFSGSTRDYHLVYTLHQKTDSKRGALVSESIDSLFAELTDRVLEVSEGKAQQLSYGYQNDFTNELVAQAMEQLQQKNYDESATLLKAVMVTEPDNLTAYKLLSQVLNYTGQYEEAEAISNKGVHLAVANKDKLQEVRIMFWNAISIIQQGRHEQALKILEDAKAKAKAVNDLLYVANISGVAGRVYGKLSEHILAEQELKEALSYHDAIQCPFGRSNTLIDLGELAYKSKELEKAASLFNQALLLSKSRHLNETTVLAEHWLGRIKK